MAFLSEWSIRHDVMIAYELNKKTLKFYIISYIELIISKKIAYNIFNIMPCVQSVRAKFYLAPFIVYKKTGYFLLDTKLTFCNLKNVEKKFNVKIRSVRTFICKTIDTMRYSPFVGKSPNCIASRQFNQKI